MNTNKMNEIDELLRDLLDKISLTDDRCTTNREFRLDVCKKATEIESILADRSRASGCNKPTVDWLVYFRITGGPIKYDYEFTVDKEENSLSPEWLPVDYLYRTHDGALQEADRLSRYHFSGKDKEAWRIYFRVASDGVYEYMVFWSWNKNIPKDWLPVDTSLYTYEEAHDEMSRLFKKNNDPLLREDRELVQEHDTAVEIRKHLDELIRFMYKVSGLYLAAGQVIDSEDAIRVTGAILEDDTYSPVCQALVEMTLDESDPADAFRIICWFFQRLEEKLSSRQTTTDLNK